MTYRVEIPRVESIDSSLQLLVEGYRFIPNRRRKFQSDIFQVTLMGQKAICISGPEAAEIFYNEKNFKRHGAAPKRIQNSIFGKRGVQTLDDEAHVRRKSLFMGLFTEENMENVKQLTSKKWQDVLDRWESMETVHLFDETKKVMCRIACEWAGVPLQEREVEKRANDLWALVDSFGAAGPRHWRGRIARKRCNRWIGNIVYHVRAGRMQVEKGAPLYEIAHYRDVNDEILDEKVAAVEVINVLRPIVAISLYVLFGALALYTHPEEKEKLTSGGLEYARMFTQEVRRYYPFTPFTGARVREEFYWAGHLFKRNQLVLLDVYGMNHDDRIWKDPSEFRPERFKSEQRNKYAFIPQGGGNFIHNHRCAGELVTITVMEKSFEFLTRITYRVPKQDMHLNAIRMPPMIKSGFLIKDIGKLEGKS